MKASWKHPELEKALTAITGVDRVKTIAEMKCATCKNPNIVFRDALSEKEYTISGMCQDCQDSVFGV